VDNTLNTKTKQIKYKEDPIAILLNTCKVDNLSRAHKLASPTSRHNKEVHRACSNPNKTYRYKPVTVKKKQKKRIILPRYIPYHQTKLTQQKQKKSLKIEKKEKKIHKKPCTINNWKIKQRLCAARSVGISDRPIQHNTKAAHKMI